MLSLMKASRLIDLVALAAVGGALIGVFVTFLMFAHLPMASEWRPLIGAQWMELLEQSRATLTPSEGVDADNAAEASPSARAAPF